MIIEKYIKYYDIIISNNYIDIYLVLIYFNKK